MYFLDTMGRRQPMIWGALAMGACMLIVGILLKTQGHPSYNPTTHKVQFDFSNNGPAGKAVLAFLYLYVASFTLSWSTPAWVVPAEVTPPHSHCVWPLTRLTHHRYFL